LNFGKSGILVQTKPCIVNVYLPTKFEANIFISNRDIAENPKSNMATAAIFNFGQSLIWVYSDPDMINLYQHTEFEANIVIYGQKIQNLIWQPPPF